MSADDLDRLLRSAAKAPEDPAPQVPFGFDIRVVALACADNGSLSDAADLTQFLRRTGAIALAVLVLASAAAYRQFSDTVAFTAPQTNEYAIADSAIQTEFSE